MAEMYVVKKSDSVIKEYYAGYEDGLNGGPVWITKRMPQARFEKHICEAIIKQLASLQYHVQAEMVEWKGGRLHSIKNESDKQFDQPHYGHNS